MKITSVQRIKRVMAALGEVERIEVKTVMAAFYVVAERVTVEYDDSPAAVAGNLMDAVRLVEVSGMRYRRLKDRVTPTRETTMRFSHCPPELREVVSGMWWAS